MARVTVIMIKPAVDYFRGWNGPVGRSISKLAAGTALAQRVIVPKRTGELMGSIRVGDKAHWARGISVKIGANPPTGAGTRRGYSYHQDQGTRPHKIRARRAPYLTFYWPRVGRVVHFRSVNHPGNPATHWATRGLAAAMRSWTNLYRPATTPSTAVARRI